VEYLIRAENVVKVSADFSKIIIDVPLQFPFKIPPGYQQYKEK